jgi:hypothetical protein
MSRAPATHYAFCLQKAMEARRNHRRAYNFRDHEFWTYLEAKWIDLANYYRSDCDEDIPRCPHCRGSLMLSLIEPEGAGYDRRILKCVCGHVEAVKVRTDG